MTFRLARIARIAAVATALMVAAGGSPALGQELEGTLKKIKASGTLTIGYRESSPPFSFVGADKRPVGYSIDLCRHVARAVQERVGLADLKLSWVPVTPESRIAAVAQGTVDIECGSTTATLSRHEQVDFSLTTFVDGGSLLTLSTANLRGLGDLGGKRIAVARGTTTEKSLAEYLKSEFITVQTVPVKDHAEGVAAIEAGKADAYASDRSILMGLVLTSKDPKRFALANVAFSFEPYALMVPRNDSAFRLTVNRTLARLYRSPEINAIFDGWFAAFGKPSVALQTMYRLNALPD